MRQGPSRRSIRYREAPKLAVLALSFVLALLLGGCSVLVDSRRACDSEDNWCPAGTHCEAGRCVSDHAADGDVDGDADGDADADSDEERDADADDEMDGDIEGDGDRDADPDGDVACEPGPVEICDNGADDDCDGITDPSPGEVLGGPRRITTHSGSSRVPSLVWTGSGYGVTWYDDRHGSDDIFFVRLTSEGEVDGEEVRITDDGGDSVYAALVWTGSGFGVAWQDDRDGNTEIYFARLETDGAKVGGEVRVSSADRDSLYPSLVWTGSRFGVAWQDDRSETMEIYFTRIDADGVPDDDDRRVSAEDLHGSIAPSLAWTGTGYGLAWEDDRDVGYDIFFVRILEDGTTDGDDVRVTTTGGSYAPWLVWTGSGFGVTWEDYRSDDYEIYFANLDLAGGMVGGEARVSAGGVDGASPTLAWTGSGFGVAWRDVRDGNYEIYFTDLGADGAEDGDDVRVTNDSGVSSSPSLVWTGSGFGVAWHDDRDGNEEIYFARLAWCLSE